MSLITAKSWAKMVYYKACKEHALPENFEHMEYADFLSQRRLLMAQIIRKAYEQLCE